MKVLNAIDQRRSCAASARAQMTSICKVIRQRLPQQASSKRRFMSRPHGRHVRRHLTRLRGLTYLGTNNKETPWVIEFGDGAMAYDIPLERFPGEVASYRRRVLRKRRFLRRLYHAFMASRQRKADSEVGRFLQAHRTRLSGMRTG